VVLRLAVLVQYRLVTGGQTERRTQDHSIYRAIAQRRADKGVWVQHTGANNIIEATKFIKENFQHKYRSFDNIPQYGIFSSF